MCATGQMDAWLLIVLLVIAATTGNTVNYFVGSWIGDSTPERGGRRRKVYRILPAGARELRAWYGGIRDIASGVLTRLDRLAEEGG